jgi:plastocyanin
VKGCRARVTEYPGPPGVLRGMVKRTLSICIAAAAIGLTACGGSDEPSAADAPAGNSGEVAVADNSFTPASVKVAVGDSVTFENEGAIPHTVTGDGFDSGSLAPGDTFTFEASEAGSFSYVCTFHPGMQGTIAVG